MSVWSGETLGKKLPALIKPFDPKRVDCAAYTLALGPEAYVTSDQRLDNNPRTGIKIELEPGAQFRIPPGQFAFLLTEEEVSVPNTALALISMRAAYKFKGLVNVSGFHVDPGWKGRLIFSVYNAGPASVVLSRGTPAFLIWFLELDQETKHAKDGTSKFDQLPDALLNNMGGNVFSPMVLSQQVTELHQGGLDMREELTERANNLRIELAAFKSDYEFHKKFFWTIVVGLIIFAVARPAATYFLSAEKAVPSQVEKADPAVMRPTANDVAKPMSSESARKSDANKGAIKKEPGGGSK